MSSAVFRFKGYRWWQFWNWLKMWSARIVRRHYDETFDSALRGAKSPNIREAIRRSGDHSGPKLGDCVFGEGPLASVQQVAFVGDVPWPHDEGKKPVPFDPESLPPNVAIQKDGAIQFPHERAQKKVSL